MTETEQEHRERIVRAAKAGMNAILIELTPDGKLHPKDLLEVLQFMVHGTIDSVDKCNVIKG